jgi:hypothetical protein
MAINPEFQNDFSSIPSVLFAANIASQRRCYSDYVEIR